jgi:hypothetical protein
MTRKYRERRTALLVFPAVRTHHFIPVTLVALLVAGCGDGSRRPADSGDRAGAARDGDALRPDTSRSGPAFLAVYREGPLDELRIVRATDGRLVVAGLCAFPDGTRLQVALDAPGDDGERQVIAVVGARVAEGRFMSGPLAGVTGAPPPGVHRIHVSATFGPTDQDPAVMDAAARGRRFAGPGVRTLEDGRIRFETRLEVPL